MIFKIISNPPYIKQNGGEIARKEFKHAEICVFLCPYATIISLYKYCSNIDTYCSEEFDASLGNIGIITVKNTEQNLFNRDTLKIEFFNKDYKEYFLKNLKLKTNIKCVCGPQRTTRQYIIDNRNRFLLYRQSAHYMKSLIDSDTINFYNGVDSFTGNNNRLYIVTIEFSSSAERENFWIYINKSKLIGKIIWSCQMVVNPLIVIPHINWETVSDNPLWKERKYDECILSLMGLKLENDKIKEI